MEKRYKEEKKENSEERKQWREKVAGLENEVWANEIKRKKRKQDNMRKREKINYREAKKETTEKRNMRQEAGNEEWEIKKEKRVNKGG